MSLLLGLFGRVKAWLIIAAGAALALGIVIARSYSAGKSAAKNEAREKVIENVERAQAIRRDVSDRARRGDIPDRVRKFYTD